MAGAAGAEEHGEEVRGEGVEGMEGNTLRGWQVGERVEQVE